MSKNPNLVALRTIQHGDRALHIAYCLLRGRTMDQIESANSDPHSFACYIPSITSHVATYHRPAEEGVSPETHALAVKAFQEKISKDLLAWHKKLMLNWMELDIKKQKRNAAKRSQVRQHPRQDTRSKSQVA